MSEKVYPPFIFNEFDRINKFGLLTNIITYIFLQESIHLFKWWIIDSYLINNDITISLRHKFNITYKTGINCHR